MALRKVEIYTRFERFWHWTQAALIITLLFTGLAIHGTHSLIAFGPAVMIHTIAAILLLLLWVFATFWLFTTGEWRQYLPTTKNLFKVARYYAFDIFKGKEHPYVKTWRRKHNPLQALTYMLLKVAIFPAIWMSGIAYLVISFGLGGQRLTSWLDVIADVHTIAAIAVLTFVIAHLYILTTGHGFIAHVKGMITGFDEVEMSEEEYVCLKMEFPNRVIDQG